MNVLIACHAGSGIGLGHLSRSLVAANAFQSYLKANVYLLIQSDEICQVDLDRSRYRFINHECDLTNEIIAEVRAYNSVMLLIDLHQNHLPTYSSMSSMIERLREYGCNNCVGIDGPIQFRDLLDLIFFPSIECPFVLDIYNTDTSFVYGWDCLLLNVGVSPSDWKPGNRVLILTGGSDATNLGQTWPNLLVSLLPAHSDLHWVTGPFAQMPLIPPLPRCTFNNHCGVSGLGPLMNSSNYAVTVFGVSFFELLYLGIPTVVFSPYGLKDDSILTTIANSHAALVADNEQHATQLLVELMNNDVLAEKLSSRSRSLLSSSGGARLCSEVASLL